MTNEQLKRSMRPILVTGAGGGIGSALVDHLLSHGYPCVMGQYKTRSDKLEAVLTKHDLDPIRHSFSGNMAADDDVGRLYDRFQREFGAPWGIINLAGASFNGMSWKTSSEQFMDTFEANVLTTFNVCKQFIPGMREANSGRIINASSIVGFTGAVGAASYCAAKAAVVGLTKSLALELAPKNITANVLGLGYFDCGLIEQVPPTMQEEIKARTPAKRFGNVDEIGGLVRFLLSDESAFTTGQVLHMNGGLYL